MASRYQPFILLLTLVLLLIGVQPTAAQSVTLDVAPDGLLSVDDTCPTPRDSSTYGSVALAVLCAENGDTVALAAGTYRETVIVDRSLTLTGAGAAATTLNGGGAGTTLLLGSEFDGERLDIAVSGVRVTGGEAGLGGGVYVIDGTVTLDAVTITGNVAAHGGAGVMVATGDVTVRDSVISNNTVMARRGLRGAGEVTAYGGGIYLQDGTLTLDDSQINGNRVDVLRCGEGVTARGGGLYVADGTATLTDMTISRNTLSTPDCDGVTAQAEGVGVYVESGDVMIEGGMVSDAVVGVAGGVPVVTTIRPSSQPTVSDDDAAVAREWLTLLTALVQAEALSPPVASRIYAYGGVTLYESVVHGYPDYQSLVGQLNGLDALPMPQVGAAYDWPTVANYALATVTDGLFADAFPATRQRITDLRDAIDLQRGEFVPVNTFNRSVAYGEALGADLLAWSGSDNYAILGQLTYALPSGDDFLWEPLLGQQPLEPHWRSLRPFTLPFSGYCDIAQDIVFDTAPDSDFYAQADVVRQAVIDVTDEQAEIARFWADDPGATSTPPGHWVSIQVIVADQLGLSLIETAEVAALTNLALGDAFISAWDSKYRYQLIRPVTYIHRYIDPAWQPLIATPPFPEYPSGHSVASGAAAIVLTSLLGDVAFVDTTHAARGLPSRSFASFTDAADEAALSRLYGGIHYPMAIENGLEQGREVGGYVIATVVTRR